jgi:alpha-1,6-mannosyltransferase
LHFVCDAVRLATMLASADAFVHAGDQETFGLSVLEALACGTPVVATPAAVDGLEITPGLELAVAGGPDAFARTVLRLLDDAPERSRLGQEGRRYVERYHAWSGIRQRLEDVYRDAAA